MKKALAVFCTLAWLLSTLSIGGIGVASAASLQDGSVYYEVVDGQATITDFVYAKKPTAVPATVGGYPVTAIGNAAFYGCTTLTTVTIPSTVKTIGQNAFGSCTNLTSVTVPNGVTTIGGGAFNACTKLATISLPNSITSIGSRAFYNTAYYNAVGSWTGSLLYIGNHLVDAKSWASGAQTVRAGTKTIAEASFYGCTDLSSVSLPSGLVTVGVQAFYGCDALENIQIPDTVTTIGDQAFYSCDGLSDVVVPNGVKTIGAEAFSSCYGLQRLSLPASVTAIGDKAFAYDRALWDISVAEGNPTYHSSGNCLIETAGKTLLAGCYNSAIPTDGSVTRIAAYAFAGQKSLATFSIPDTVTHILGYAFSSCSALTQISIPTSVSFIGSYAFDGCSALADVYYGGEQSAWSSLVRGETSTSPLKKARVHYNTLVPHWELTEVLEAPTCTQSGWGLYTCDCGHSLEQSLPPTGHPAYEPIETVAPTCSADGYTVYRCVACDHSYQADFVSAAHTFEDNVCVWCGLTAEACLSSTYPHAASPTWVVRQSGAVKLELTFSENTVLADGDVVSVYNGQEELIGTFTDTELAGQTVEVMGDTAVIRTSAQSASSAVAVTSVTVVTPAVGDITGEGSLDMMDALLLYSSIASGGGLTPEQQARADYDGSGVINMFDALLLYGAIAGA
ncbi:MAG: leucine-rich repeat protein [Clostridia bacterium]|nr:leucine-rich repeat protein [Clostridia bacterium]